MSKPLAILAAEEAAKGPALGIRYNYHNQNSKPGDMDYQEFIEHVLSTIGITKNWKGSNAMWRDMAWTGTPEECIDKFGTVPSGAFLFILDDNGGEIARGYQDGLGNASHVGIKTGKGLGAVHSSASRGGVFESVFHDRTIRNGGWNRIGLCKLLDYGPVVSARLNQFNEEVTITLATVTVATSGGSLNLRETSNPSSSVIATIPNGAQLNLLEKTTSAMWKVTYEAATGWASCKFLTEESQNVSISLDRTAAQALFSALEKALGV